MAWTPNFMQKSEKSYEPIILRKTLDKRTDWQGSIYKTTPLGEVGPKSTHQWTNGLSKLKKLKKSIFRQFLAVFLAIFRFFQIFFSLQHVRGPLVLSFYAKKSTHQWTNGLSKVEKHDFRPSDILDTFGSKSGQGGNFSKNGLCHFCTHMAP